MSSPRFAARRSFRFSNAFVVGLELVELAPVGGDVVIEFSGVTCFAGVVDVVLFELFINFKLSSSFKREGA